MLVLVALCLLVVGGSVPRPSLAASTAVTVTASVPSAVSLTNNCGAPGYQLGTVLPGASGLTATGASVCSFSWSSSNDTAMLRMGQADGTGAAMGTTPTSATVISSDGGDATWDVSAFDATRMFAVTQNGRARRTTDGGATWPLEQNVGSALYTVAADTADATANTWYIAGDSARVYKTTNGQAGTPTWTSIKPALTAAGWPATAGINDIAVYKNAGATTIVLLVGDSGWVARSADGGTSFTAYQLPGAPLLRGVSALQNSNTAYIIECGDLQKTTTDAINVGAWSSLGDPGCALGVSVGDATHIYISSGAQSIETSNGATLSNRAVPVPAYYNSVAAVPGSPLVAYMAGSNGTIIKTVDGGVTWTRQDPATSDSFYGVAAPTASAVTAVGNAKVSVRTADGGTTWAQTNEVAGKSDFVAVTRAPDNGQLMVQVGGLALIQRSTDGGSTWANATNTDTHALFGVDLADDTYGWAVGAGGTVLRTTDGGLTWSVQYSQAGLTLQAVKAVDRYTAVAVGSGGTILRTTNGGASWTFPTSPTTNTLMSVDAYGSTIVATGIFSKVARSTDGGVTWALAASVPWSAPLRSVSAGSASTWYVTGDYDTFFKSTDGGNNWSNVPAAPAIDMLAVDAVDANVVYVATQSGSYKYTNDGGTTWGSISFTGGVGDHTWGIVADANTVYGVGAQSQDVRALPSGAANSTVSDYGAGTNWGSVSTTNMFGVCLQGINGATTTVNGPTWVVDATGIAGQCEANDTDPWKAIPTAMSKVASSNGAGLVGRGDVVFGVRMSTNQSAATYRATVVFEALAPAV